MAKISEQARPGTLTGLELFPALQAGSNASIPLFGLGNVPRGTVLTMRAPFVIETGSTADSDPGAGLLKWNNATQTSATVVYIDDADSAAGDMTPVWPVLAAGGFLYIQGVANRSVWQKWNITSVIDAAGYAKIGVTLAGSNGTFTDADVVEVSLQQPASGGGLTDGDKGDIVVSGSGSGMNLDFTSPTFDDDTALAANSASKLPTQRAVKAYVDSLLQGLSWKKAVRAATTANGTLASAYANSQVIDGVTLATGDRILIKNQTTASENGIYTVNATGAPTRASDADAGAELVNATVYVSEGSTLADTQWTCSTNAPITLGSTNLTFVQLAGGAGGGLTNFTEAVNTAAPNATIPVVSLTPNNAASRVDIALRPKGSGAFSMHVPDNLSSGGNKRGVGAVDLQLARSAASEVASGGNSFAAGGYSEASGDLAVAIGYGLIADGNYSTAFGQYVSTRGRIGYEVHGSGIFGGGIVGEAQQGRMVLRANTTDATQTTLTSDGGARSAGNQVSMNLRSRSCVVKGTIQAFQKTTDDCSAWEFTAFISRPFSGSAAMVVACTPTLIGQKAGASAWAVAVDADTTNNALRVRCTGEASKTIRWVCSIYDVNELGFF